MKNNTPDHLAPDTAENGGKRKKLLLILSAALAALALIFCAVWFLFLKGYLNNRNADPVFVSSVAEITGSDIGITSRYAGVVEPQKTIPVNKDDTKTIAEILVTEGQNVNAGDPLFSYNIEEMQLTLEQDRLTLESAQNTIAEYKRQISDLEKERANAPSDSKLSYTIKIQTIELNIKEQEYQLSLKNKEIEKLAASIENNVVTAPEAGIIKSINTNSGGNTGGMGGEAPSAFITILSTGEYRIKATITEQQRYHVNQGQPVIIHSRTNPEITWTGVIETIDFDNPVSDQNNGNVWYGGGGDSGQGSSRYNFFVALDDGNAIAGGGDITELDETKLIIGQHVYIEPSTGDSSAKPGLWLPSYYLVQDGGSFVWAQNGNSLEKRNVTVGTYDSEMDLYEITDGLTQKDFIAMPTDTLRNGLPTTTDPFAMNGGDMDGGMGDGGMIDGDMMGGGMAEGDMGEGDMGGDIMEGEMPDGDMILPEAEMPDQDSAPETADSTEAEVQS